VKLVHLVGFTTKKFVMMHGHTNVKYKIVYICIYIYTYIYICIYIFVYLLVLIIICTRCTVRKSKISEERRLDVFWEY